MADSGTDNAIYRLGRTMGIRLPRIDWAEEQIDKEGRWLPILAGGLPAPVPVPLAMGAPGHGYPFDWLVYPWLDGVSLDRVTPRLWVELAHDIAEFVLALERIPRGDGPAPRRRGTPMSQYDSVVRAALGRVDGLVDGARARQVWCSALDAGAWPGAPVWVHGDLLPGNLLVRDGRLSGVIDWSGAGVGDPACDAMVAWSLPPDTASGLPADRRIRRRHLGSCSRVGRRADDPVHPLLRTDSPSRRRASHATAPRRVGRRSLTGEPSLRTRRRHVCRRRCGDAGSGRSRRFRSFSGGRP